MVLVSRRPRSHASPAGFGDDAGTAAPVSQLNQISSHCVSFASGLSPVPLGRYDCTSGSASGSASVGSGSAYCFTPFSTNVTGCAGSVPPRMPFAFA